MTIENIFLSFYARSFTRLKANLIRAREIQFHFGTRNKHEKVRRRKKTFSFISFLFPFIFYSVKETSSKYESIREKSFHLQLNIEK